MFRWASTACLALSSVAVAAPGPMGVSWSPTYGLPPAKAERFMPQARALGASFSRVTLYWSQLEPKPGAPRWADLDAYLDQLDTPEEGMITLASASPWATRTGAWVFPSSPAKDPAAYTAFVRRVVEHAKGRVRYFQAETEPNNPFFWSGSADDYAAQARLFYKAVKDADPQAQVVLGSSDGLFDPTGADPFPGQAANLAFLARLLAGAQGAFDLFDLHLYGDPYTIPARVAAVRQAMRAAGADRPVIATEYGGPSFFEFHANRRWFAALQGPAAGEASVRALRDQAATLAPETRLFLTPGDPALVRLQANDLVVRTLLALSSGLRRVALFDLSHDASKSDAPDTILYGAFRLFDHGPQGLGPELPLAAPYRCLAGALAGMTMTTRIALPGHDDAYAFRIERQGRPPLLVAWRRPPTLGAVSAPLPVTLPWHGPTTDAAAIDGSPVPTAAHHGALSLTLTDRPILAD